MQAGPCDVVFPAANTNSGGSQAAGQFRLCPEFLQAKLLDGLADRFLRAIRNLARHDGLLFSLIHKKGGRGSRCLSLTMSLPAPASVRKHVSREKAYQRYKRSIKAQTPGCQQRERD